MPRYGKGKKPMKAQARAYLKGFLSLTSRHQEKQKQGIKGGQSTGKIHSIRTFNTYHQTLAHAGEWLRQQYGIGYLRDITPAQANAYLEYRTTQGLSQKTLSNDRVALEYVTGQGTLNAVKTQLPPSRLRGRAYTPEQVQLIAAHQSERNALSTHIAYHAGLRAHELITLQPRSHGSVSPYRAWRAERFSGREGVPYLVTGKGGLRREVRVPTHLSQALEARRLETPCTVRDRGVNYQQHYDIGGGNAWSRSVTDASQRALGWSTGAHGLRHAYAQERLHELQQRGFFYQDAKEIVSQELGHFRADVTNTYLR